MNFDIYRLDKMDPESARAESALEEYQDALLKQFAGSPEGQARLVVDPEMGFWSRQLIYYGYNYLSITLPHMGAGAVEEIVTELFPRKISTFSPEDAEDAIPELIAFWQYLKRAYNLSQADAVLHFLHEIEPGFQDIMNDPSKFGMAKSFFMMGQAAGYDMTDEAQINQFMNVYNANIMAQGPFPSPSGDTGTSSSAGSASTASARGKGDVKKKRFRKKVKASRKRNRGKRK